MNIAWIMANGAFLVRCLKFAMLLPPMIAFVQAFENPALNGKEKKTAVLGALDRTTDVLERRGMITAGMNLEIDAVAGELIDIIVEVFNSVGIFGSKVNPSA